MLGNVFFCVEIYGKECCFQTYARLCMTTKESRKKVKVKKSYSLNGRAIKKGGFRAGPLRKK